MRSLLAVRRALFELPPGAVLALLAAVAGLTVLVFAFGTLVVFDVIDAGPPGRHRARPRVDMLCHGLSYLSPQRGREASTDHDPTGFRVRPPARPR